VPARGFVVDAVASPPTLQQQCALETVHLEWGDFVLRILSLFSEIRNDRVLKADLYGGKHLITGLLDSISHRDSLPNDVLE
jgi:hypothetical protein